jgi:hypothetical protein
VLHFGHKCQNIILSSCLCCVSDEIIKNTHKTPQKTGFEEEKSFDKEYKSFSTEKPTQISFLEGSAPLYTVRERWHSVPSFGGALQCFVPHSEGVLPFLSEFWTIETNQGRIPSISEGSWIESEVKP